LAQVEARKAVLAALDESLRAELVQMTVDLVNISSPTGEEAVISDYVYRRFGEIGMKTVRQEVEPGRNNVVSVLEGTSDGRSLYFNAHFDTSTTGKEEGLPVGHKAKAQVTDGWIYGLGVSNMKNAFAGYYGAIRMLQKAGVRLKGDITMGGVVGEIEKAPVDQYQGSAYRGGGLGTAHMLKHGVTADFCICGEPTGLRLQPGNTGYIFAKISTFGKAQHTWSKQNGVDAIAKMVPVIAALREWEVQFERRHPHPFMKTRVGISAIQGGYPFKPSICPSPYCNLYIDIRTLPSQKMHEVRAELREVLEEVSRRDGELDYHLDFYLVRKGYEIPFDHELVRTVAASHRQLSGAEVIHPEPYRYAVSADTSIMYEYDIPGITYGAGGITRKGVYSMYDDQGECLGIENLLTATRVYALCALDLCGVDA
jgi:acetylornithine deacetylase